MFIYFSSVSNNTQKFVESLALPNQRLPLYTKEDTIISTQPYILVVPTYGGGTPHGAVPKQVIKFLNVPQNRENLVGIIGIGNTNFGEAYQLAARIISEKTKKPLILQVELFGTRDDREEAKKLWKQLIEN